MKICVVNPLTALDDLIRPKPVVSCSGCSASHRQNYQKPQPLERGDLLQNGIQHFSFRTSQSPGIAFQS